MFGYHLTLETADGKFLASRRRDTLPEAFADIWEIMRVTLSGPFPPEMRVISKLDAFASQVSDEDFEALLPLTIVAQTVTTGKTTKADCDDCGFPDVRTRIVEIKVADTLMLLRQGDFMAALVDAPPQILSSKPIRRQEACECCEMLKAKGINPKTNTLTFLEARHA